MPTAEQMIESCRASGMRVTAQRRAIFEVLAGNDRHPTAEEIYRAARRKARGVSLATVYNTLETLHALGELGRLRLSGGSGSGADRFDPETRPHHHFRCDRCHRVFDAFGDLPVPALAGLEGCHIERAEITLAGRCAACVQAGS